MRPEPRGLAPFRIDVPASVLEDLAKRLARARLPGAPAAAGWDYGIEPDYLRRLVEYWRTDYGWSAPGPGGPPFAMEQILTDVMIYWLTGSANAASWLYTAARRRDGMRLARGELMGWRPPSSPVRTISSRRLRTAGCAARTIA